MIGNYPPRFKGNSVIWLVQLTPSFWSLTILKMRHARGKTENASWILLLSWASATRLALIMLSVKSYKGKPVTAVCFQPRSSKAYINLNVKLGGLGPDYEAIKEKVSSLYYVICFSVVQSELRQGRMEKKSLLRSNLGLSGTLCPWLQV